MASAESVDQPYGQSINQLTVQSTPESMNMGVDSAADLQSERSTMQTTQQTTKQPPIQAESAVQSAAPPVLQPTIQSAECPGTAHNDDERHPARNERSKKHLVNRHRRSITSINRPGRNSRKYSSAPMRGCSGSTRTSCAKCLSSGLASMYV